MSSVTNLSKHRGFSFELSPQNNAGYFPYKIYGPDGGVVCIGAYSGTRRNPPTAERADAWLMRTVKRLNDDNGYKTGKHSRKVYVINGKTLPTLNHDWQRPIKVPQE